MVNFEIIKKEYESVLQKLSNPESINNSQNLENLLKQKERLEKIIEKQKEIDYLKKIIEENKTIVLAQEDRELVVMAEMEIEQFMEKQKLLEKELENLLNQQNTKKNEAAIIEIRAGTGGEEAALFVKDLFKMYSKYGRIQGWKEKILNLNQTELGGYKEIVFELRNGDIFSKIQYESGVHRVQRIPLTEKIGRIHTSTATVAILLRPQKTEIKIDPKDLKIDFFRSSGPGGQNVNKRETAVRITHLPTGIVVTSQTERVQQENRQNALAILEAKLLEKKEKEQIEKLSVNRRRQIGSAERAEKIRTYNFPQNRVTDHRIKKSWHNIEEIMNGKIDPIIKALSCFFNVLDPIIDS